jgi:DNA-binding beta-propeller fold protein YncE
VRARLALAALGLPALAAAQPAAPPAPPPAAPPEREYRVLVGSEAVDQVALVRFGPGGIAVERTHEVGMMLTDPDGPHGVASAPDGKFYYVSTAHGTPYGSLWKFPAEGAGNRWGRPVGRVTLGSFPATLQVTPDGAMAFVVNFNLHGEMVPSSVSVVATDEMVEIARITTCAMPHGSRLTRDGARHYSACMMDDALVEIDARELRVARHMTLTKGREHGMAGAPHAHAAPAGTAAGGATAGHGMDAPPPGAATCSPTWAQPSPDGRTVWVACNRTNDLVEVDVASWSVRRRVPAGDGVYNLATTSDGRLLLATNKRGQSVSIFDAAAGRELARVPTSRRVVHGVAVSPDDRYAFVSVEGIGSEPGTVDVIDLRTRARVASVDVGQMAGGIDVLPR